MGPCDADLYPIVLNGAGIPIDLGRRQRLASRDQIRALRAMYATCGVGPHCQVPFDDCHIHHVKEWTEHHGPTDLDNLIPTCSRHHHAVHEGGWTLRLEPDRTIRLWRPDGTPYYRGITTTRHAAERLAAAAGTANDAPEAPEALTEGWPLDVSRDIREASTTGKTGDGLGQPGLPPDSDTTGEPPGPEVLRGGFDRGGRSPGSHARHQLDPASDPLADQLAFTLDDSRNAS